MGPAATLERFGQVLERQIVNTNHERTRSHWRGSKLNVENVDWIPAQFGAERQWNAYQRSVWKSSASSKVWPSATEPTDSLTFGHIDGVLIDRVDFREGFDEVSRVGLISAQAGPNRVSVNCYSQVANCSLDLGPDITDSIKSSRETTSLLPPTLVSRRPVDHEYPARECGQLYREVRAGSKAWRVALDLS